VVQWGSERDQVRWQSCGRRNAKGFVWPGVFPATDHFQESGTHAYYSPYIKEVRDACQVLRA
jgi:hypothetical protein